MPGNIACNTHLQHGFSLEQKLADFFLKKYLFLFLFTIIYNLNDECHNSHNNKQNIYNQKLEILYVILFCSFQIFPQQQNTRFKVKAFTDSRPDPCSQNHLLFTVPDVIFLMFW